MNERPTEDFAAGRSWHDEERSTAVDRLEEPVRRHSPVRRALAAGIVAALVGGAVLSRVLTHDGGAAAASRTPTPSATHVHEQRIPAAVGPPQVDGITATGRIAGTVSPGGGLVFDVTLRSSRFFSLHPCPSYTVRFGTHTSTRPLGCANVPYLASLVRPNGQVTDFQPVLPAGTDVVFRVRVAVPHELGPQHVQWTLNAPRPRPRLSGVVQVTGAGSG